MKFLNLIVFVSNLSCIAAMPNNEIKQTNKILCNYSYSTNLSYTLFFDHTLRRLELDMNYLNKEKETTKYFSRDNLLPVYLGKPISEIVDIYDHITNATIYNMDIDYNHYEMVKILGQLQTRHYSNQEIKTEFEIILVTEELSKRLKSKNITCPNNIVIISVDLAKLHFTI
jgi:hypothetical protein